MTEIWKDINGYDGYQVSNFGRVRTHNKVSSSAMARKLCEYPKQQNSNYTLGEFQKPILVKKG